MAVSILQTPFDPWQLLQRHQQTLAHLQGQYGATAVFIGTMRDLNEGDKVTRMCLEHYPDMTQKYLQQLLQSAAQQWDILDAMVVHRVGDIDPDDTIVLVAVWSAHRAAAYAANRYIMEELKSKAPFWKKETLENQQTRWVEKNTPG